MKNLAFIGGVGFTEILVIGGVAFLFFGAKRLPQIGRGLAEGIREFKKGLNSSSGSNPDSKKDDPKDEN